MTATPATIWTIILVLGVCTFLIRFSFLGMIGDRNLPVWMQRALRYTPVAVMPGLVAPLILWPAATGGEPDPARLAAAAVTVGLGMATRNVVTAVLGGFVVLYLGLWLIG